MIELPYALVLALGGSALAVGLLCGLSVGFRVVSRDAALLAVLDKRVAQALTASSEAKARADLLEATWAEHLEELERKRAKARAERQRADEAAARSEEKAPADSPPPELDLTPRERRRQIARLAHRGGTAA